MKLDSYLPLVDCYGSSYYVDCKVQQKENKRKLDFCNDVDVDRD